MKTKFIGIFLKCEISQITNFPEVSSKCTLFLLPGFPFTETDDSQDSRVREGPS